MSSKIKQMLLAAGFAVSDDVFDVNVLHVVKAHGAEAKWVTLTVGTATVTASQDRGPSICLGLDRVVEAVQKAGRTT